MYILLLGDALFPLKKNLDIAKLFQGIHERIQLDVVGTTDAATQPPVIKAELGIDSGKIQPILLANEQTMILHFISYGTDQQKVYLRGRNFNEIELTHDDLIENFVFWKELLERLQVLVLNIDYSAEIAQKLSNHINYVVGIKGNIATIEPMIEFARGFYLGMKETPEEVTTNFKLGLTEMRVNGYKAERQQIVMYNKGVLVE